MADDDVFENPQFKTILIAAIVSYLLIRWGIWAFQTDEWGHFYISFITLLVALPFFILSIGIKFLNPSNSIPKRSLVVLITCLWIIIIIDLFSSQFGFHQLIKKDDLTVQASEKEPKPNEEVTFAVKISLEYYCAITEIIFKPDVNKSDSLVLTYDGIPGIISGGIDQHSISRETFEYSFTNSQDPKYSKILVKYETIKMEVGGYRIIKKRTDWLSLFPN